MSPCFGSIWWVSNRIWGERIRNFKPLNSKPHPGVYLNTGTFPVVGYVPMVCGKTLKEWMDDSDGFIVAGVSKINPQDKTIFGYHIGPVAIKAEKFADGKNDIIPNRAKQYLNPHEEVACRTWLRKKGFSI